MLNFVFRGMAGVSAFAATAGSFQAGGLIPSAPETTDPMAWAFMAVVALVVLGAIWVVRFVLTSYVSRLDLIADKLSEIAAGQEVLISRECPFGKAGDDRRPGHRE